MKNSPNLCFLAFCLLLQLRTLSATNYYVSPTGADSNEGTNLTAPFRTVGYALQRAAYGDTILLRGGIYREPIVSFNNPQLALANLKHSSASWTNMLTIRSYATNEKPTIKGSLLVNHWTPYGKTVWMKSNWTNRSQQVFADGRMLKHLGWNAGHTVYPNQGVDNTSDLKAKGPPEFQMGLEDMLSGAWPDSFYHDTNNSTLYVRLADGGSPNARTMEVSVGMSWYMPHPYVKVDGITFQHSSTTQINGGWPGVALVDHSIVQNCAIEYCDFTGISLHANSQLLNCRIANNGMIGFGIGSNSVVSNCSVLSNHYLPFDFREEAAGTKIIGVSKGQCDNLIIENNEFGWNKGPGIWFDSMNSSNAPAIIRGNDIHHNGDGVMLEISTNILVYNNLIEANAYRGIYFSQSANCKAFNNTVIVPYTPMTKRPDVDVVCAFALVGGAGTRGARLTYNISITNNLIYDETVYGESALRTVVYESSPTVSNVIIDYNCYYAPNAANKGAVRFNVGSFTNTAIGPKNNQRVDFATWHTKGGHWGPAFDAHSIVANPLALSRRANKLQFKRVTQTGLTQMYVYNVAFGRSIVSGMTSVSAVSLKGRAAP